MKLIELEGRKKELGLNEQIKTMKSQSAQLEANAKVLQEKLDESESELAE